MLLLYGSPKVGKTTKLAELPNCLIIDNEKGTDFVRALKIQVSSATEWELLCLELKKKPMMYDYIAVDTISTLEDWAERVALLDYKASPTGKNFAGSNILHLANGGGYLWLRLAFKRLIEGLSGTTRTIILVAHLREKMLESNGKEVSVKDIELTGKLRSIVSGMADAVGYIYRQSADDKLRITFKTSENVLCGSRCAHLKGQDMEFDWANIFKHGKAADAVKMGSGSISNVP